MSGEGISESPDCFEPAESPAQAPPFRRPNILHAVVFLLIAAAAMIFASLCIGAVAMVVAHMHGEKQAIDMDLLKSPLLNVAAQAIAYLTALLIAAAVFREWWQRPMSVGIAWDWARFGTTKYAFLGLGLILGLAADAASYKLPVPKELPVDKFFQSPATVWVIAIFGTTLGPLFEEITFRGFLYPAFKTAWEWIAAKLNMQGTETARAAMIFSVTLTSAGFAAMHAPQIGYNLPVLALLFTVGAILCAVRIWSDSVAASTIVHAGYNLWNFLLMGIATGGFRHLDKLH